jgi:glycosyltransferase involved in cell wall biosynthesis
MINVVIDASCLMINRYSGLSEVVHNLLLHLPLVNKGCQYTSFMNYFRSRIEREKTLYQETTIHSWRLPRRLVAFWWDIGRPSIDLLLKDADIYHSLHVQIPPTKKIKTILTVHDCRCLAHPELYEPQVVKNYQKQMNISLGRVDLVVTVSEFTRQEVLKYFPFPEDRVRVIHNGLNPSWTETEYRQAEISAALGEINLPQSYLLYTGTLDPRKNLNRLIEAHAACRVEKQDFPDLAIAGVSYDEWLRSQQAIRAKQLGVFDKIHICGVVEKDILAELNRAAHALCYPSLYEGFGLPPLEAMSAGIPVLASNSSALPEIIGDAACLVDPINIDDIARGLNKIVFDEEYRQNLIRLGYKRIERYSWFEAAAKYVNIYNDVLSL